MQWSVEVFEIVLTDNQRATQALTWRAELNPGVGITHTRV